MISSSIHFSINGITSFLIVEYNSVICHLLSWRTSAKALGSSCDEVRGVFRVSQCGRILGLPLPASQHSPENGTVLLKETAGSGSCSQEQVSLQCSSVVREQAVGIPAGALGVWQTVEYKAQVHSSRVLLSQAFHLSCLGKQPQRAKVSVTIPAMTYVSLLTTNTCSHSSELIQFPQSVTRLEFPHYLICQTQQAKCRNSHDRSLTVGVHVGLKSQAGTLKCSPITQSRKTLCCFSCSLIIAPDIKKSLLFIPVLWAKMALWSISYTDNVTRRISCIIYLFTLNQCLPRACNFISKIEKISRVMKYIFLIRLAEIKLN